MASGPTDHRPDLRLGAALVATAVVVPGALVVWTLAVRDRLPDPVAIHWGISGQADGWAPLVAHLWLAAGIAIVLGLPLGAIGVFSRTPVFMRRIVTGIAAWMIVFVTVLIGAALYGQLDLADAADAPLPGPGIALGAILGVVVAFAVGAAAEERREAVLAQGPPPPSARRLDDPPDEPRWSCAAAGVDTSGKVVLSLLLGVAAVVALFVTWWLSVVMLLAALLSLLTTRPSTTVDADGLTIRSGRWRLLRVGIDEVAEADVVDVDPFWEFGGWGLRVDVAGRTGLVTRKGPAVRVRRGNGSEVLVTVDDAETAAATLNTLADRLHATPAGG